MESSPLNIGRQVGHAPAPDLPRSRGDVVAYRAILAARHALYEQAVIGPQFKRQPYKLGNVIRSAGLAVHAIGHISAWSPSTLSGRRSST